MKQPELGKKISELRREKGLTQEELVEKCNISVRTLQRIELGEVTPRIFTVKTILAALDFDLSKISENEKTFLSNISATVKKALHIDIGVNSSSNYLIKQLNIAWIFGSLYLILSLLDAIIEFYRTKQDEMIFTIPVYIAMKIIVMVTFFFFQRGFILIGHLFKNYLLKIVSFILVFGMLLVISYDIASLFYNSIEREFIVGAEALTFGGIGIIFGISLIKLQNTCGQISIFAGVFEISAAFFFLTVILAFLGQIILIPAELLEIVIIYKSVEIIKSKPIENELF